MKKNFYIAFCAIMMALCTNAVQAQEKKNENQRMSREQMSEAQAKYIANELALDDATAKKLVKTFCDCQKELWEMGPKDRPDRRDKEERTEMTESETEKFLKERMARSRKLLDLREKYYEEYSKFLTQKQIRKVYELEKRSMKHLAKDDKDGKKGGPSPKGKPGKKGDRRPGAKPGPNGMGGPGDMPEMPKD